MWYEDVIHDELTAKPAQKSKPTRWDKLLAEARERVKPFDIPEDTPDDALYRRFYQEQDTLSVYRNQIPLYFSLSPFVGLAVSLFVTYKIQGIEWWPGLFKSLVVGSSLVAVCLIACLIYYWRSLRLDRQRAEAIVILEILESRRPDDYDFFHDDDDEEVSFEEDYTIAIDKEIFKDDDDDEVYVDENPTEPSADGLTGANRVPGSFPVAQ